jgi:hypothetical protein
VSACTYNYDYSFGRRDGLQLQPKRYTEHTVRHSTAQEAIVYDNTMVIRRRQFSYGSETGSLPGNVATSIFEDSLTLSGILDTTVTTSSITDGVVRSNYGRAQTVASEGLCINLRSEPAIQPVSAQINAFDWDECLHTRSTPSTDSWAERTKLAQGAICGFALRRSVHVSRSRLFAIHAR